jgi:hypothetical protein
VNNIKLHPWIGSNPIESVDNLKKTALIWNIASTISTLAMGVISFSVVCASFFVTLPTSVTLIGVGVATPLLSFATSYFKDKASPLEFRIAKEQPIAEEFEKIMSWNEPQIISFLSENQIPLPTTIPLKSLLPLIARYRARCYEAISYAAKSSALLESRWIKDREIRLWQRLEGWRYREEVILPARVEAAFSFAVLKNPYLEGFPSDHFNFVQKSFAERFLSITYDREDHYLEFLIQKRDPLTFDELFNTSDPIMVYELLQI